jgi:hypothetical protein
MIIRLNHLKSLALLYAIIPILIFIMGWLKIIIAIPLFTILIYGVYHCKKDEDANKILTGYCFHVTKSQLFCLIGVALLWSFFAGQGGFFYQSADHHYRNAVLRDLITYSWPVLFPQFDTAMVYYIGHWLLPALAGKFFLFVFGTAAGWLFGNIFLYLWTSLGVFITTLLLIYTVKAYSLRKTILALLILIFFSGLDIAGIMWTNFTNTGPISLNSHIEWWAWFYQFSSNSTLLFWVFNQTIVPWIMVLLFINEQNVRNYILIGSCVLPFAPMPFIGLLPFLFVSGGKYLVNSIKNNNFKSFIADVFSPQNCTALFSILPVFLLYFAANNSSSAYGFRFNSDYIIKSPGLLFLLIFWSLECGIYLLFIFSANKKNYIYYITGIALFLIPVFRIGAGNDFAMRASIPALFILMIMIIQFLNRTISYHQKIRRLSISVPAFVLIIALGVGAFTPLTEFRRAIATVIQQGKMNVTADNIKTFSNKNPYHNEALVNNFVATTPNEKFFFKYLAK